MSEDARTRRRFLRTAGAGVTVAAAGCLGGLTGGSSGGSLKLLDFAYVYPDGMLQRFEERHGVTVELQSTGSSARSLSLLRADRSDHDVVALGNYAVTPAIDEGLIQPVDLDQVPTYDSVFDFLKRDYFERDGQVYGVPRSFGQTPLVYNTEVLDEAPTSWRVLWDDRYEGRVGGRDDARLQFLYCRAANGLSPLNPTSAAEVDFDEMRDLLTRHVELSGGLWGSGGDSVSLLRNDQVAVEPAWNYVTYSLQQEGFPVERVYPEEGTKAWFLQLCVREGAQNADLAHTFINDWHEWMGYEALMEPSHIAVPNEQTFEDNDIPLAEYGLDDPNRFIYEDPKPQSLVEQYTKTWNEAKNRAG
ncbi:ABC transporter substrate-binding protein [Salinigranum halophilum]|uniref:ABC transporter substrate-binding protein n=1 Tax=Salinigranum halophilum TaxID=2565931 RepID=UPI00115C5FEC|nr:extracellular solute-binding protein [Salinigranum halophilum]